MTSQPSAIVLASAKILESRAMQVSGILLLGLLVGFQGPRFAMTLLLLVGVSIIVGLCLLEINWAICLLVLLSPFHFALKVLSASLVVDVWRELFFLLIFASWVLQLLLGKRRPPGMTVLNFVVGSYVLWGIVAILKQRVQ